ncbi:MAG: 16S rRNA (cytosine(1402)-N(4))-methyltransferase RsmH [Gammaproteobacteria bacterium]|nr:16S rRNA (cytosine(1402)-N(4))-methyltransferase RsmH [Gammaproteobacteria bacterium]
MESRTSATSADSYGRSLISARSDAVRFRVPFERESDSTDSFRPLLARHSTPTLTRVVTQPQPPVSHEPVLALDLAQAVVIDPMGTYLDATFGRGGHAQSILTQLGASGRLIGIDRDLDAAVAARDLEQSDGRFKFSRSKFGDLRDVLAALDIHNLNGICFDVGVSTPQLKTAERGFAFDLDGPLDMRMDNESGISAAEWVNEASIDDVTQVLKVYGDVRAARSIARQIVSQRPLKTTFELVEVIRAASPARAVSARSLAQVFQAIRIYVNDELNELQEGLEQGFNALCVSGRLAVISFHSIEHRLVRDAIQSWVRTSAPRGLPVRDKGPRARYVLKNVRPSYSERQKNPASRSAMMQVVERLR